MQQTANHAVTEGVAAPEKAPLAAPSRARAAELSASAGNRPPTLDRADRWVWTAALGIALMTHAAIFYALAREPADLMAGGGGQQVDAISVTLFASNVLEARESERLQSDPPAAATSVASTDGAPESSPAAATEQQDEKKEQPEETKEKSKEDPVREADAVIETPHETQRKQQASAAPATGGDAARSDAVSEAKTSAPAAASPGAIREYARYVAQALAKTKPKGSGSLGTVHVKFVIAGDGGLAAVEIAKSSGSSKLDNIAVGAVQRTRFVTPPAGMTSAQLTYEVPYHFR